MAELHPELAKRTAAEALARAEHTPCDRGSDLGWALDTITELSAMVCNLADRVPPQDTRERTPTPCKQCGSAWWEGDPPKCMRCTAPAATSTAASGVRVNAPVEPLRVAVNCEQCGAMATLGGPCQRKRGHRRPSGCVAGEYGDDLGVPGHVPTTCEHGIGYGTPCVQCNPSVRGCSHCKDSGVNPDAGMGNGYICPACNGAAGSTL